MAKKSRIYTAVAITAASIAALGVSNADPVYRHKLNSAVPVAPGPVDPLLDTTPDPFLIAAVSGVELGAFQASEAILPVGFTHPAPIMVGGEGSPAISVNGGPWVASAHIEPGQSFRVRVTAPSQVLTPRSIVVIVGGYTTNFTITTRPADTTPDGFTIAAVDDAELGVTYETSAFTPTGFTEATLAQVTGSGSPALSVAGGNWVQTSTIQPGQDVRLRMTASSSPATPLTSTVTIGGVSADFTITTRPADTTPDAYVIAAVTDAQISTVVESAAITPVGYTEPTTVSASGPAGNPEVSVESGPWSASAALNPGQSFKVRLTSASSWSTDRSATVTVGGVQATFTVTTLPPLGTASSNPAASCYEIQQAGTGPSSGLYWLGKGATPYQAHCDMAVAQGGWTKVNGLTAEQVNAAMRAPGERQMMVKCSDGGTEYLASPPTAANWSWTQKQLVPGTWSANGTAYACGSAAEWNSAGGSNEGYGWGFGCSQGGGEVPKFYPGVYDQVNGTGGSAFPWIAGQGAGLVGGPFKVCSGIKNYGSWSIFVR